MKYFSYGKKKNKRFTNKSKHSLALRLTSLAYDMGCVERGLNNPESKISASYSAGKNYSPKSKRSLF